MPPARDPNRDRRSGDFEYLFNAMTQGVVYQDRTGAVVLANPAMERIVGLSLDDLRAWSGDDPRWQLIREDGTALPADEQPARIALRTGRPVADRIIGLTNQADGRIRWLRVTATPHVEDGAAEPCGAFTTIDDITELKTLERALRRSEERFRLVAECSNDILYEWNIETGGLEYFGGSHADVPADLQQSTEQWIDRLHPEERADILADIARHAATGERFMREHRIRAEDGRWLNILTRGQAILDATGRPTRWVGASTDITDQRDAEGGLRRTLNLFEAVIEGTTDPVFVKDLGGRYLLINTAGAARFGRAPADVVGKTNFQLVAARLADPLREHDDEVIRTGTVVTCEIDGPGVPSPRRYLVTKAPYRDATGEIAGLVGVARDITDMRRLEDQFRQAHKMEAIGRLAGGVAHDFNNLLTVILGYIDELQSRPETLDLVALREVKGAAERATQLTSQLLAFSRRQILQPVPTDLNALLANTERMLSRVLGEDVALRFELSPDLGTVRVDAGQFEQVLLNLVVNARDAMPHGGSLVVATANLQVTAAMVEQHPGVSPGPYVRVTVTDTGVGMSRDTMARIFEPFFTTKDRAGTGLGLATVYGFVKQSGGDVWVTSQAGRGSSFALLLPRVDEVAASSPVVDTDTAATNGHETILLVEDEAQLRALLGTVLERHGYTVHRLADVHEVRPWLETHHGPLHLVVTDMVMPNGTGLEVERVVRALRPGLKILFMSGYAEHAATNMGDLPSDSHYLQKPFTPRVLATIVRDLLDRPAR